MAASSFRLWVITGMGNLHVRYGGGSSAVTTDCHPWAVLCCRPALATGVFAAQELPNLPQEGLAAAA
ncbi:hypothetical protein DES47_10915 [Roseateles toxinivorans]|uniref:Uncharacterized protein n=1 Tax=Roseateles toxinivorans TaxID=270368 RepID=A0A4R6QIS3_9BURK|nr:hypothetical protein DES47_10915 [Roseateles toxinivorans]